MNQMRLGPERQLLDSEDVVSLKDFHDKRSMFVFPDETIEAFAVSLSGLERSIEFNAQEWTRPPMIGEPTMPVAQALIHRALYIKHSATYDYLARQANAAVGAEVVDSPRQLQEQVAA
jgi:hypothetical protein